MNRATTSVQWVLDELRMLLAGVGVLGKVNNRDVIWRDSVLELVDRRRAEHSSPELANDVRNPGGRKRVNEALDLSLRISGIADFASLLATDAFEPSLPDDLQDLVDSVGDGVATHPSLEPIATVLAEHSDDLEFAGEQLVTNGVAGVALKVSTPVRRHLTDSSWESSWGYYTSTWVYADSFDEAWLLGVEWAKEKHAYFLAKFQRVMGAEK